jgi:16S rRNA (guanine527-N7)-methyltransferase
MAKRNEVEKYLERIFPQTCGLILEKFDKYYQWLLEENQKINLISRKTDPDDMWTLHFLDSLLSVGCVDYSKRNVLDFGTGGGFPGVPLAILYPDSHFAMLASTKKKIQSVKSGVQVLGLTNCSFIDTRLEEVTEKYYCAFDIVISRSVRIIPEYKKILFKLLKNDGLIVLYKSQNLDDAALFANVKITDVSTPLIGERKIVVIRKSECI